ncbi:Nn.00g098770.m01.CDS01 [Neocucurbitaria sp. VM-36]
MSNATNGDAPASNPDAEFAQAFKELQRGEHTAAALENHLDSLEKKIAELLAQAEKAEQEMKAHPTSGANSSSQAEGKSS